MNSNNRTRKNNLANIQADLFSNTDNELCDTQFTKRILEEKAELTGIYKFDLLKQGEGSYGSVNTQYIKLKDSSNSQFGCVAAVKESTKYDNEGISPDFLKEIAVYARTNETSGIAKGLFASINDDKTRGTQIQYVVMEHYVATVEYLIGIIKGVDTVILKKFLRAIYFQVIHALNEFHELGLIHKDLKPENIFITHDGRVLLADFGLTEFVITGYEPPVNYLFNQTTPPFEPPDVQKFATAPNTGVSQKYDIWSLGCCMHSSMNDNEFTFKFYQKGKWRNTITAEMYGTRVNKVLSEVETNFGKDWSNLLSNMLKIDLTSRATAKKLLEDPIFEHMTIKSAAKTVMDIMRETVKGEYKKQPSTYKGQNISKVRKNILKKTNTRARNRNISTAKYFRIEQTPLVKKQTITSNNKQIDTLLFDMVLTNLRIKSIYNFVHSLELYDRYLTIKGTPLIDADIGKYMSIMLYLATKVNSIGTAIEPGAVDLPPILFRKSIPIQTLILDIEYDIVKTLHGDLLPQKDGIVDTFFKYLKPTGDKKVENFSKGLLNYMFWDGKGDFKDVIKEDINAKKFSEYFESYDSGNSDANIIIGDIYRYYETVDKTENTRTTKKIIDDDILKRYIRRIKDDLDKY